MMTDQISSLRVACSPDKRAVFEQLATRFNSLELKLPTGPAMNVHIVEVNFDQAHSLSTSDSEFDAVTPESSYCLRDISSWANAAGKTWTIDEVTSLAVSPIVFGIWRASAKGIAASGLDKLIEWPDIVKRMLEDRSFRWGHAVPQSPGGILAVLAICGAGFTTAHQTTSDIVTADSATTNISVLERTVSYYGASEYDLFLRLQRDGSDFLNGFVLQEHLIAELVRNRPSDDLTIVPVGPTTVWADHPLALLKRPQESSDRLKIYKCFVEFLLGADGQRVLMAAGFHPAGPDFIAYVEAASAKATSSLHTPSQHSAMMLSDPRIAEMVRSRFSLIKRRANICLVVDTSDSMEGRKLEQASEALMAFVRQTEADNERIALIEFNSDVTFLQNFEELSSTRNALEHSIDGLNARGGTALLRAIQVAYHKIQDLHDGQRINGIIVLSDGRDNRSRMRADELLQELQVGNEGEVPIVVYCVAYGDDADIELLTKIARATRGEAFRGEVATVVEVYARLSRLF